MSDSESSSLPSSPDHHSISIRRANSRLGLILFAIYLALYTGFVLINALAADWMEITVVAGLNLAIVYGFGLIIAALVMAMLYGMLCKPDERTDATEAGDVQ